jgi:hypothetical protein
MFDVAAGLLMARGQARLGSLEELVDRAVEGSR